MEHGIVAYAAYLPRHRLTHEELGDELGVRGGAGRRVIASYDEDSTTMAVEAARATAGNGAAVPGAIFFATTTPPYLDKTNAAAIHAALDLGHDGFAVDVAGSARSAVGAARAAAHEGGLAALSDVRTGLPTSSEERGGADGAAAFLFGPTEQAAVELVAIASTTAELLDRWRLPTEVASHQWEERFGVEIYMPLIRAAVAQVREQTAIEHHDHVIV